MRRAPQTKSTVTLSVIKSLMQIIVGILKVLEMSFNQDLNIVIWVPADWVLIVHGYAWTLISKCTISHQSASLSPSQWEPTGAKQAPINLDHATEETG